MIKNQNYKRGQSSTSFIPGKYGSKWDTIEFELMTGIKAKNPIAPAEQPIVGTLVIGNKRVELTFSETNKIITELVAGQQAHTTAKKLGQLEEGMGTYRG
tara:strand:+ start:184 stop:483 length:300 start_codon:yes stop_codon:yes gene_type:complete